MSESKTPTQWHLLLGRLLYSVLEPLGVQVLTEVPLLSEAPKADILLLQRPGAHWTPEQRQWLADGLRHTDAGHLLIEFKYTQSLTLKALQQINAYDYFYRVDSKRKLSDVGCFLVVASTPQGNWQSRLGFTATAWPGVYQGTEILSKRVQILLLNELAATANNAPLKCFATRQHEWQQALIIANNSGFTRLSEKIYQLIAGLRRVMSMPKTTCTDNLTPDIVMAMGQEWIEAMLKAAPLAEVLHYHNADEVLSYYKPDEVLRHYKPGEVLSHYKPDEVLSHYKPEQRLAGLTKEQRLAGLTEEQIRAYLERLQQSKN